MNFKEGYDLVIEKGTKEKLNMFYLKDTDNEEIKRIRPVEQIVTSTLKDEIVFEKLKYQQQFRIHFDPFSNTYIVSIRKQNNIIEQTEGTTLLSTLHKMDEKLEYKSYQIARNKLQLYQPLFIKIQKGYQFSLKADSNQEFHGLIVLQKDGVYQDLKELEEQEFAFIYDFKNIKEKVQKGSVLDIAYDNNLKKYYASQKAQQQKVSWQEISTWQIVEQASSSDALNSLFQLNKILRNKEWEKKIYVKK